MIRANPRAIWVKLSRFYTRALIGFFFGKVKYYGHYEEKGFPILLVSNHFSFYDGFIQILLNQKVFKRTFIFMMLEKKLRENLWLTKIGASSINKGNGSNFDSLNYAVDILQNGKNLFLFFPQGKIKSVHTREFFFEKGMLSYILKKLKNEYQLVFNVNLIDYGTNLKPDICVFHKTYPISADTDAEEVEREFNHFAKACFKKLGAT